VIDLDASAVAAAYARIAPSLDLPPRASEAALRVAIREADHLVDDVYDVPAALLFALGRTPRCFAGFRAMSVFLVAWQSKRLGFRIEASPRDLAQMLVRVARRDASYEDVRSWMGARLLPFGG
jgi:hypothetical protein